MFLGKVQLPCEVRCATKEVATEVPTKAGIVWWRAMLKGLPKNLGLKPRPWRLLSL
jgi:hypothetical protein